MLLKYTPGIDFGVEADKNRLLAEAYCIRGICISVLPGYGGCPFGTGTDRKFK